MESIMKNMGIQQPCSEKWNQMLPTEKGAFCQNCATEVIDFTSKSNAEIKATFKDLIGKPVCARIGSSQMELLQTEFAAWRLNSARTVQSTLIFSLIVVFGLSLFSCSTQKEKETILEIQKTIGKTMGNLEIVETVPAVTYTADTYNAEPVISIAEPMPPLEEMVPQAEDSMFSQLDEFHITHRQERIIMGIYVSNRDFDNYLIQHVEQETTEYDENGVQIPKVFNSKAYPNPANINTTLEIVLPVNDFVDIQLYDLNGRFIQTVFSGDLKRGTHSYRVDLFELPAGVYLFTINSRNYSETTRVVKVRD